MVRDARYRAPHHEGRRPYPEEQREAMRLEGRSPEHESRRQRLHLLVEIGLSFKIDARKVRHGDVAFSPRRP